MQAQNLKESLKLIIQEASTVDANLARRLEEINRWVKDVKPGSLMAKKFVLAFLVQVIGDSTALLQIQALSSPNEQKLRYECMAPTDTSFIEQLVDALLYHSDNLSMGRYLKLP